MNLILKIATKQEIKLVQDFFSKNLTKDNPGITNKEFLCSFGVEGDLLNENAHTLYELKTVRQKAIEFLYEKKYL